MNANGITPYHARYYAMELRRRALATDVAAVGTALFDARVDLNPHQVDAALFALRALRERERDAPGRLLADEVGLGKTIEAGLVLCQLWAERKRRLLVLTPAALRKQWVIEIESKFGLPARIAEGRGDADRFGGRGIVVASYPYAAHRIEALVAEDWDLIVCDEAHRLRRAHEPNSKMARTIGQALRRFPKLLLTATPLHNSLMELYGICHVVDERVFGDVLAFKARFMKGAPDFIALRDRLRPIMHRTLRKEVAAYVKYTERHALTQRFRAPEAERRLYDAVSEFLAGDHLLSVPNRQRALVTMAIRKLLASSSSAVAGVMRTLQRRLRQIQERGPLPPIEQELDEEGLDDAWLDELLGEDPTERRVDVSAELEEVARLLAMAEGIVLDQRANALLLALQAGFEQLAARGAPERAVIFTESRLTQAMLRRHLEASGYAGDVVCFHGGPPEPPERAILDRWLDEHSSVAAEASRAVNLRAAIVDHFEQRARILISTEAGAEGLNLQFCAMVVNYDLPWNPQRVEQRIGRCHRYGQKHDVVVVNFVEETNVAEQRVLELLQDKLMLFDGVFGASDAVLGTLESGVGFERRIHRIFETCRTTTQIEAAFAELRAELEKDVTAREERARKALLEHFDADVHDRLRVQIDEARARMNRIEQLFWGVTRWALPEARFDPGLPAFDLSAPVARQAAGRYELLRRGVAPTVTDPFVYRLTHPLGEHVLSRAAAASTPGAHLVFDISGHGVHRTPIEALRGRSGWLRLDRLRITGFADEEHLLFSGGVEGGSSLDPEIIEALFLVSAIAQPPRGSPPRDLEDAARHGIVVATNAAASRNLREFESARERIYRWAEDQVLAAEEAVKELRKRERDLDREARSAPTLETKGEALRRLAEVEVQKIKARHRLNDIEDDVRLKRAAHLDELERRVAQRAEVDEVFSVSWEVV